MISAHAKDSFERIFRKAAQTRLVLDADDRCEVTPLAHADVDALIVRDEASDSRKVVILTISSIVFRLLLILHVDASDAARRYYLKDGDERPLHEAFLETANLCCGAMNQALLQSFPDLGMSTPYVLDARCLPHLHALKPALVSSYSVAIGTHVRLAATVCVCTHAPLDFVADTSDAEETSGELELF